MFFQSFKSSEVTLIFNIWYKLLISNVRMNYVVTHWWLFYVIYTLPSCKRSVARRVTVLLTPRTLVIMFVILSKESFKKKAVCYSIKQRSKLLLLQKEANTTMQWSHVKTFEFVFYCFYCLTSIFFVLFCFCEINFDVFTIFLSFLI